MARGKGFPTEETYLVPNTVIIHEKFVTILNVGIKIPVKRIKAQRQEWRYTVVLTKLLHRLTIWQPT